MPGPLGLIHGRVGCVQLALGHDMGLGAPIPPTPPQGWNQEAAHAELGGVSGRLA